MRRACSERSISLSASEDFARYRYPEDRADHWMFRHGDPGAEVCIVFRASLQGGARAWHLGEILAEHTSSHALRRALRRFAHMAKREADIDALVVRVSRGNRRLLRVLLACGFVPHGPGSPLIVKPICLDPDRAALVLNASRWSTMWGDKDDWYTSIAVRSQR
jgi:hypothetical protein